MQGSTETERRRRTCRPACVEASRDHLQSTSRMALTVLVSSFASWASVAAVQGLFL